MFIIPIIVDIHGHRFEVYILVPKIHENVYLLLGIENKFELEGVINSWDCCFNFLNRSSPIFQKEYIVFKPNEKMHVKVSHSVWHNVDLTFL